jgi:hypothetical protein
LIQRKKVAWGICNILKLCSSRFRRLSVFITVLLMPSVIEEHVLYQIFNAPVREYPYPHIYVEDVFPDGFYAELRENWPNASAFVPLGDTGRVAKGAYPERFVLPITQDGIATLTPERRKFWSGFSSWFGGQNFCLSMIDKFEPYVRARLGDHIDLCTYGADALAVRDLTNYSIGPHTDAPHRLITMLFYCPENDNHPHLGTSIFWPLEADFRCQGGPHYPFAPFKRITTMPYKRNTLFAFFKDDSSFHGVEPIQDRNFERDLLLYDVRVSGTDR